ncbi:hypothetical protein JX266_010684 [Neoarthrinium moseri]|uniref:uncharacterized protein n=1 Tax=Neoarthrinium moseri TaxID=1658444 RepID=UPI001FDD602F|nr:uncharacterized protein JN550_008536 [Neoarthrinium moseri]KAI1843157.1 hypothetical protein JX266_010684 [Neoarthrinium moseri]KAI1864990.1 hypothetical protein JN550_008536 [Neoarthrinium moseri]
MWPSANLMLLVLAAFPTWSAESSHLDARQSWTSSYWSQEFSKYGCRPVIFIFARATIEPGNMGNTVGPRISNALKAAFGVTYVATEGVDYLSLPDTNFFPGGAPPFGVGLMQVLLSAAAKCPNSKIVASGYSQGAALTHRAIQGLSDPVKDKIAGVVTFGDTQTWQDGGQIRGFDANKTLIICNIGDLVCIGTLYVMPVHLDYVKWVPTAVAWLIQKLLYADEINPWWDGTFSLPPPPGSPRTDLQLANTDDCVVPPTRQ